MRSAVTQEDTINQLHSEIQSVVELTHAHNTKIYMSGPLFRRLERNPNGTVVNGAEWEEVWAQLGGTTLALWDMKLVRKASEEGREEHPTYANVTDSHIHLLDDIVDLDAFEIATLLQEHTNVISLNTAGLNRIWFACSTPQSLLSWITALRLAAWEKSRLEEVYTGHLLRLSMMETGPLREPKSTLQGGRMEGWAKVRIGGSTEWQRVWVVIFQHSPASMDAEWQDLSAGPVKNRFSTLLSGTKSPLSPSSTGRPLIVMYTDNKINHRRRFLYTALRVTQAFAVYPGRPEIIQLSTLFKIEATIKEGQLYWGNKTSKARDTIIEERETHALIVPEVGSGKPGSSEMLKWLIAIHDAFGLYGRPQEYIWDPRDPRSTFFMYPYGVYRDHLFLNRELAEALDVRTHETSRVKIALMNVLKERVTTIVKASSPNSNGRGQGGVDPEVRTGEFLETILVAPRQCVVDIHAHLPPGEDERPENRSILTPQTKLQCIG